MAIILRMWQRINEPRVISVTHAVVYAVLCSVALGALVTPPATINGAVGTLAMRLLAGMLAVGGALGVPTALAGIWWLERTAASLVMLASGVYLGIILALQIASGPGSNRMLQAGYVLTALLLHFVRWHRIKQRPYDPDRVNLTQAR